MVYPNTIDTMASVISTQTLAQAGHTARHNELANTVNGIQSALGLTPQGAAASVAARLTAMDTSIGSKANAANPVFTGVLSVPSGTAAAPTLTFTGSTTNGLYLAGANQLGISTAGVARATIDATGLGVTGTIVATSTVAGSGLAGSLLSSATPAALGTAAAGTSAIPARQDHVHSNTSVTLVSPTITGTANVTGALDVQEIRETVLDGTITTNVLTVDYTAGTIMYIPTAPTANFTVNLTNAPTDNGKVITVSVMVTQGTTGYIPNAIQVGGVAQTLRWLNNVTPTPTSTAGKIDIFTFSLIRRASAWIILGNSSINF